MFATTVNRAIRPVPAWPIYIIAALWAGWLFYLALTGALGPEPVNALEREYGAVALKLLIAGLVVSPLRRFTGINLIRYRRAIGLVAFGFVVAHFAVWAILDVGSWSRVWEAIAKRPYVMVGMAAFVLLIPLAVTSNNASIRKLGRNWRRLHWLVYPVAVLAALHFIWLVKGWPREPFIYAGIIAVLLGVRLVPTRR